MKEKTDSSKKKHRASMRSEKPPVASRNAARFKINPEDSLPIPTHRHRIAQEPIPTTQSDTLKSRASDVIEGTLRRTVKYPRPYWWCKLYVDYPRTCLAVLVLLHLLLSGSTLLLLQFGYDVFPVDFSNVPLDLVNDDTYRHQMAWIHRDSRLNVHATASGGDGGGPARSDLGYYTEVIFVPPEGENAFAPEHLERMREFEIGFASIPPKQTFCAPAAQGVCYKPRSILRHFDDQLMNDSFENAPEVLALAAREDPGGMQYFLGKGSVVGDNDVFSEITRALFFLRHNDSAPMRFDDFLETSVHDWLWEQHRSSRSAALKIYFNNAQLFYKDVQVQVFYDMCLAVGSLLFIFMFMWLQTASFFFTVLAVFTIVASFFEANLLYRFALDYKYFGILHVLSVFIILGIGADDVFVFLDAWKATSVTRYPSLAHRLSACYQAAGTTLVTSVTTAVAFLVSWLSPLLALSSFGIFSAVLVVVNYVSVIVCVPAIIACYARRWEKYEYVCCLQNSAAIAAGYPSKPRAGAFTRCFGGAFYRTVTHGAVRGALLLLLIGQLCFSVYQLTKIEPNREQINLFRDTHNYGKFVKLQQRAFKPTQDADVVEVVLAWGIRKQDMRGCHKSDSICDGVTVYDDHFDLNPLRAQTSMMEVCNKLRNLTQHEVDKLAIKTHGALSRPKIICFTDSLFAFMDAELATLRDGGATRAPLAPEHVRALMTAHPEIYNTSTLSTTFSRYFEVALEYWLYDRYALYLTGAWNPSAMTYKPFLGMEIDLLDTTKTVFNKNVTYGKHLRYAAIQVTTTLPHNGLGYVDALPVKQEWDRFLAKQSEAMPTSVSSPFHTTPQGDWHNAQRQKELVYSAIKGIIIGLLFALPVLTMATKNVIVAIIVTLTISCITASVVSLIPLFGWKIGVLESLNLSLVVGLAVDYVVHFAEAYNSAPYDDRGGRVHHMLESMGTSVLSGALTTLGASAFMLFTQIVFFMQFGLFMFGTIFFSLLYALFFFAPVMSMIGPEEEVGSLRPLLHRLYVACMPGREKSPPSATAWATRTDTRPKY